VKNVHTYRRDRKYVKIYGPAGSRPLEQDIEAPKMQDIDAGVPFGIRALQKGIEIEGVWISQPNTPAPGSPILPPHRSPVPSIISGLSPVLTPNGKVSPPDPMYPEQPIGSRPAHGRTPRIPSFNLDSLQQSIGSFDQLYDYQTSDTGSSIGAYSSTLDALEGRSIVRHPSAGGE